MMENERDNVTQSNPEKRYICNVCDRVLFHRFAFKNHICSHLKTKKGTFVCDRCKIEFKTKRDIILRYSSHLKSDERPFRCDVCSHSAKSASNLQSHKSIKHKSTCKFQCYFHSCKFSSKYHKNLIRHMAMMHGMDATVSKENIKSLSSPILVFVKTSKPMDDLELHLQKEMFMKLDHTINTSSQTNSTMGKDLSTKIDAGTQTNIDDVPENTTIADDFLNYDIGNRSLNNYSCENNNISVENDVLLSDVTLTNVDNYLDEDMNENIFSFLSEFGEDVSHNVTIPLSDTSKFNKIITDQKILSIKPNENVPGVHDNYGLVVQTDMLKVSRRYRCKICQFYFTGRSELDWHKKSHVSQLLEHGFKCFECDFRSSRWEEIKEHISLVHSDLRPLQCQRCSFATRYKKDLERHLRTHNSTRPFLCQDCGKKFVRSCHLKNHLLKKHKIRPV